MNVFFVCNWFPNRNNPSEGLFLKHYAEAISVNDDVTIFFAEQDARLKQSSEEVNYKYNQVEVRTIYYPPVQTGLKPLDLIGNSIKRIFYLRRIIGEEFKMKRPDIFHFNVVSPSVVLMWYYKFFRSIPFVYSEHWDIPIRVKRGLIKKWLPHRIGMKLTAMFSSGVIVCSKAMKEAFHHFNLSDNVFIISSVIFLDNKSIRDEERQTGKKILLHVSSLGDFQKNITGIIDAVAEVAKNRSDFELHFIGKGKEIEQHKSHAQRLQLLDRIILFQGFVSDEEKREWFEKSAFHILFSNFEGYSLVTAESIYYGRPVIATRCGGPEDFVNEQNGVLVEPNNVDELSKAISFLLDHYLQFQPEELRKYGESIFSPSVVGMKHHQLYQAVLQNKN
ncbi:MAG: glycosyltransferase family 4 protein [Bacteroidetes bacterium]|nr:glycosyltransferase family 4 protein [Bacteroidota bacterium]